MQAFEYSGLDYANAMQFKRQWQWQLQRLYQQKVDLTLIPATATTAPALTDERNLLEATKDLARNTYPSAMAGIPRDRKSTRLNSSHVAISYAVFCLKKKTTHETGGL